ncbi:MAG: hypothetical protein U1E53_31130 [Dongiaceae bacterium]
MARPIASPTVTRGLSACSGDWKTIWMRRSCSLLRRRALAPAARRRGDLAGERAHAAGDDARQRALAAAGFADQRQRLARRQRQAGVAQHELALLDRAAGPAPPVGGAQRAHGEQRLGGGPRAAARDAARHRLHRRQQGAGVVLLRRRDDLPGRTLLDDAPVAQHDDARRDLGDHREVVADIDRGGVLGAEGVLDCLQHVDLRGDVERRRRLVQHQQLRRAGHRHGGHDALLLAAARLQGVAQGERRRLRQPQQGEQLGDPAARAPAVGQAVQQQRLADLRPDGHGRVEGGRRALRDIGDVAAADAAPAAPVEAEQVGRRQAHPPGDEARARPAIAERGQRQGRLAGARLADEGDHLAGIDPDRDAVEDRRPAAPAAPPGHRQPLDGEQAGHQRRSSGMVRAERSPSQSTTRLSATPKAPMASAGSRVGR